MMVNARSACEAGADRQNAIMRPLHRSRPARSPRLRLAVGSILVLLVAGCTDAPGTTATGSASTPAAVTSGAGPDPTAGPATDGAEQFTPVLMSVPTPPRWFTGTDGRVHLVYELQLTNAFPVDVTVTGAAVLDASTGTVLQSLDSELLTASMSLLTSGSQPKADLAPSTVGVIWFDVPLDDPSQVPARIDHELTVSVPPGLPVPATITSTGAAVDVDTSPPTVIGPPLEGPGWFAVGSCCDGPHRRTAQPIDNELWVSQRFAIDFNKIDDQGFLAVGNRSLNESWPTFDQTVLAVADAEVTIAQDGLPDQIPEAPTPVTIENADGNYVILELSDGVYAFYAHLKSGSVAVRTGDRVTKGQPIGRTGNSGSSTGPHLHFQVMDRPSALAADGLPYEFDAFTVTGRGPALDDLMTTDPTTTPVEVDPANAGPRTDQLPLSRDVVEFAAP